MPTKCLLACENEFLLGAIIEDILNKDSSLKLTAIIGISDAEVIEALESQHPDVIIYCHKTRDDFSSNITYINNKFPELLMITITPDDNYMQLNGKQEILVTQSSDLLSVIHNHISLSQQDNRMSER